MVIELAGTRAGVMHMLVEQADDRFRVTTVTSLKVARGETPIEIKMEMVSIETADGRPISICSRQDVSLTTTETLWEFKNGKMKETVTSGSGKPRISVHDAPAEPWLPMYAAEKFSRAQREKGVERFEYQTLSPEGGRRVVTITSVHEGKSQQMVDGKPIATEVWKTTNSLMPSVEVVEHYHGADDLLLQETPIGGLGTAVMRRASREEALKEIGGAGPEMMARSFVKASRPIENSMNVKRARLKLTVREGTLPDLPSAGAQRVEMGADRKSAVLTIDIDDPVPASEAESSEGGYLAPSAMVNFDDGDVDALSRRADADVDLMKRAEALRRLVRRHISKKGMATAFASAAETARTKTGDCSEHGVLLAAMLRAQRIPSRVAIGLVYVDEFMGEQGIFGWHMWTQALIDGKWIDLDATLPVRHNAAHVLTNVSSLADGLGAGDMSSVMQMMGNVDIEVLETAGDA